MTSKKSFFFLSFIFITVAPFIAHAKVDFANKGKAIALEIATNPGGFFYDLHQLSESVIPTRTGRRLSIGTQIIPAILPFTMANISGRLNLISEHASSSIPQVEVFGGISKLMALNYVDTEETEGAVNGKHYGVSLVYSAHPKARIQVGYQISELTGKVTFKKKPIDIFGTSLSQITVGIRESFILMGAELLRGERRYFFTQMGLGLDSSKIIARIMYAGRVFDWGFTVMPESPLVIYPNFALRF